MLYSLVQPGRVFSPQHTVIAYPGKNKIDMVGLKYYARGITETPNSDKIVHAVEALSFDGEQQAEIFSNQDIPACCSLG